MNAYPNTPLAWDRTRVMARSVGVDLVGAVVDGWLTRRDLDDLVCTCDACGQDSACQALSPRSEISLSALCTNQADLESLRL